MLPTPRPDSLIVAMAETLLALDAGTTGVTGLLFDAELRPLAKAYREFPQGFLSSIHP